MLEWVGWVGFTKSGLLSANMPKHRFPGQTADCRAMETQFRVLFRCLRRLTRHRGSKLIASRVEASFLVVLYVEDWWDSQRLWNRNFLVAKSL